MKTITFTTDITTVKAFKIRGKYLKYKTISGLLQNERIYYDPYLKDYYETETLKHFRDCDEKTYDRVKTFYYDFVQGWKDAQDRMLTIENSVKYIKANLGLE